MAHHSIVETPDFISDVKEFGITNEELAVIIDHFAQNPADGTMIKGTGGARKVRFGGRGKGKSGGYRVISYYGGDDIPVFLLNVFAKGDKVDLSKAERNALAKVLERIAATYRQGVQTNVESR